MAAYRFAFSLRVPGVLIGKRSNETVGNREQSRGSAKTETEPDSKAVPTNRLTVTIELDGKPDSMDQREVSLSGWVSPIIEKTQRSGRY